MAVGTPARGELDPARFALGGRLPERAFAPRSVDALAELLRTCDKNGERVVFFGAGTLQGLGNLPARYDVAVSLGKLSKLIAYERADLTIAAEAAMTVASLDRSLAANRQFVPLDAPLRARTTLGGVLATGWRGPRRARYGSPRDLVIGTTVVLADGTVARAGGMVVKNSTGYDVSKLYIGSLGTLGALVRVNLKTLAMPDAHRVALAALPERTRERAVEQLAGLEIEPTAALLVRGFAGEIDGRDGVDGRLFFLFEGSAAAIDRATRDLRSALGAAGVPETTLIDVGAPEIFGKVVDAYISRIADRSVTYRCNGLPGDLSDRMIVLLGLSTHHELFVETIEDLRTGDLIARIRASDRERFDAHIVPFDDDLHDRLRATILAAPDHLRDRLNSWGQPPSSLPTMRALKLRFDPNGTLAPGRFVGGI